MGRVILLFAGILITFISLEHFSAPYIWISLWWTLFCLFGTFFCKKSRTKLLLFYTGLLPFTFGIYETYLWVKEPHINSNYTKGVVVGKHTVLGRAPLKNSSAIHTKHLNGKLLFKVVYTIDADGLRIAPPFRPGNNPDCLLFFGGSFTFGEGVADEETMPYRTGIKTGGKYRVYNFGFRGYGPHQMLSALEHGMVESIVKGKPKYAIYQILLTHINRSAGLYPWTIYDPKYVLDKNGSVIYKGTFSDEKLVISQKIMAQLQKSLILKKVLSHSFSEDHIRLFFEIVDTSRKIIETRYPGCEFHALLWNDDYFWDCKEVLEKLRSKKIRVHLITDILPNFYEKQSIYRIHKYERHPTPLTHEIIAEYVSRKIIRE